jgi:hypothetical protein
MIFYNISAGMCFLASIITKSEMFFIGGIILLVCKELVSIKNKIK